MKITEGMEATVDAAAYMAELRSEVEDLREELALAKRNAAEADEAAGGGIIGYIQNLDREEAQSLTSDVSEDVYEAMGQLVSSILADIDVPDLDTDVSEASVAATSAKLRELLITQLVSGYKLRELEVKDELKDKFWGVDGAGD